MAAVGTLQAQCLEDHPGGSKVNPNRPSDADTPAAVYSPIDLVNNNLPHWICLSAGYRTRYEGYGGNNAQPGLGSDYLLTRFRLGTEITPVSWFKIYAEAQDADAFFKTPPLGPPYQETWDLRRAHIDLGNIEGHWGIRVGRQDLNFGDGRLVGTSYWRNASKGFDAIEAVTNGDGIGLSGFAASPVVPGVNGLGHHQAGNDLYGIDGKLSKIVKDGTLEPYLFWRVAPGYKTETGTAARLEERTAGLRFSGTIRDSWDYDSEGARQFGEIGTDVIRAWAWMGIGGYTFNNLRWKTRLFSEYDFASGDRNAKDGQHGTFDQMFPNIHDHFGLADQFAWQNLKMPRAGARVWLRPNWIAAASWEDFWLANATDGFYNSTGAIVARDSSGRSGTHVAEEYDVQTNYRLNRELEFGAGVARVLPGEFLVKTGHPSPYTYSFVMMSYNFF